MLEHHPKNHLPVIITSVITCLMIAIVVLTLILRQPLSASSPGTVYEFTPGITTKALSQQLYENNIIAYPRLFEWYIRFNRYDKTLQAGEYYFPQGISMQGVVRMMRDGGVIKRAFRVQEGSTVRDLIENLSSQSLIAHTIDFSDAQWFKQISDDIEHPEGQFMPETYVYSKGMTDVKLLKRMHKDLNKVLEEEWKHRSPDLPYKNAYQALIAASIIEKETGVDAEREMVSGVVIRRLAKNMRLQMDPTVIYGLGKSFDGNITKKDLQTKTPYNTYLIDGLPPTPIALPSRDSIHAAMHPQPGTSLYFVSKGDGTHVFSDTLEGHNTSVIKYQLPLAPDKKDVKKP